MTSALLHFFVEVQSEFEAALTLPTATHVSRRSSAKTRRPTAGPDHVETPRNTILSGVDAAPVGFGVNR